MVLSPYKQDHAVTAKVAVTSLQSFLEYQSEALLSYKVGVWLSCKSCLPLVKSFKTLYIITIKNYNSVVKSRDDFL